MKKKLTSLMLIMTLVLSSFYALAQVSLVYAEEEVEFEGDFREYINHYKFHYAEAHNCHGYHSSLTANEILYDETFYCYPSNLSLTGSGVAVDTGKEAPRNKVNITKEDMDVRHMEGNASGMDKDFAATLPVVFVNGNFYYPFIFLEAVFSPYSDYKDIRDLEYGRDYTVEISGPSVSKKKVANAYTEELEFIHGKAESKVSNKTIYDYYAGGAMASTAITSDNIARRLKCKYDMPFFHDAWQLEWPTLLAYYKFDEKVMMEDLKQYKTVDEYEQALKNNPNSWYWKYTDRRCRYSCNEDVTNDDEAKKKMKEMGAVGFLSYYVFRGDQYLLEEAFERGERHKILKKYELVFDYTREQLRDVWFAEMKNSDSHWKQMVLDNTANTIPNNWYGPAGATEKRTISYSDKHNFTINKSGIYTVTISGIGDFIGSASYKYKADFEKGTFVIDEGSIEDADSTVERPISTFHWGSDGEYYYQVNGRTQWNYTGLAEAANGYYYVKNGIWQRNYTGLYEHSKNHRFYYLRNGKWQQGYNGLYVHSKNGKTYYLNNGIWDRNYTGLYQHSVNKKYYYLKDGLWQKGYNGLYVHSKNKWTYYLRNGIWNRVTEWYKHSKNGLTYYIETGLWRGIYKDKNGVQRKSTNVVVPK